MNALAPEHLDRIVATVKARQPVERYAALATRAQIADKGFNLNIPRYVDTFEAEAEIDIAAVQREIVALEADLAETRRRSTMRSSTLLVWCSSPGRTSAPTM